MIKALGSFLVVALIAMSIDIIFKVKFPPLYFALGAAAMALALRS